MTKIPVSLPPPDRDTPEGERGSLLRYAAVIAIAILAASATIVLFYGVGAFDVILSTIVGPFR